MVDALALGASGETHGGSSPLLGTKKYFPLREIFFCLFRGLEEPEARLALRQAMMNFQQKITEWQVLIHKHI